MGVLQAGLCWTALGLETGKAVMDGGRARHLGGPGGVPVGSAEPPHLSPYFPGLQWACDSRFLCCC